MRLKIQILCLTLLSKITFGLDPLQPVRDIEEFVNAHLTELISAGNFPREPYTTPRLIEKYGFPAETHHVETEDGYILTVHRIPSKNPHAIPVFLQHGIMLASNSWVLNDPSQTLAFLLAREGYDVWIGNARGNYYSKSHVVKQSWMPEFWNFSWNEMGVYDLPAVFGYMLKHNPRRLYYVGHSMGTTMFYVFAATKPAYAAKRVRAMISLAPVSFTKNIKTPIILLRPFLPKIRDIDDVYRAGEFYPELNAFRMLGASIICSIPFIKAACESALMFMCGYNFPGWNHSLTSDVFGVMPSGTSALAVVHYAQMINSGKFGLLDYGAGNTKMYGRDVPPDYPIHNIRVPIVLFWSDNDWLSCQPDVSKFQEIIRKSVMASYQIPDPKFEHLDFIWGLDSLKFVNEPILKIFNKLNSRPEFSQDDHNPNFNNDYSQNNGILDNNIMGQYVPGQNQNNNDDQDSFLNWSPNNNQDWNSNSGWNPNNNQNWNQNHNQGYNPGQNSNQDYNQNNLGNQDYNQNSNAGFNPNSNQNRRPGYDQNYYGDSDRSYGQNNQKNPYENPGYNQNNNPRTGFNQYGNQNQKLSYSQHSGSNFYSDYNKNSNKNYNQDYNQNRFFG